MSTKTLDEILDECKVELPPPKPPNREERRATLNHVEKLVKKAAKVKSLKPQGLSSGYALIDYDADWYKQAVASIFGPSETPDELAARDPAAYAAEKEAQIKGSRLYEAPKEEAGIELSDWD